MVELELRETVAKNRELEAQLTKRNEQYIFDLKKSLAAANLSEELQAIALGGILPELVEGQKTGKTARQLFGTVGERTEAILAAPAPDREGTKYEMWLDNSLLIFVFMTVFMTGVMPLLAKNAVTSQQQGLISILVGSISGGYAFYLIHKKIYVFDRPGADQTGRPGGFKSILIMIGIMLVWIFVFMLSAFIPAVVNPVLDPTINIILGAAAFGLRYFLKKKYNIRGSILQR
ncbi:MAG: DUF1129 domain-containing protein [Enterococcus sp.]